MAGSKGIRAGKAYVELGVDDKIAAGLKAAQARLSAFGAGIRSIGTRVAAAGVAAVGGLAAAGKVFADTGSAVFDMSKRTGVSSEALSELGYAAEQSGGSMEDLEKGIRFAQKAIAGGSKQSVEAIEALGLSIEGLSAMAPEEQFVAIGNALGSIEDPAMRSYAAMTLLGRGGASLIPMFAEGADGLEAMRKQARDLGIVVDSESAAAADRFGDVLGALNRVVRRTVFEIGGALAPELETVAKRVTRAVIAFNSWIKENRRIVVTALQVSAAVVGIGVALVGLGLTLTLIGGALGGMAALVGVLGTAFAALGSIVGAILTPIGLVVAAVVGIAAAAIGMTVDVKGAFKALEGKFDSIKTTVADVLGGISDALMAGDITLAAEVLWAGLQVAWEAGGLELRKLWNGVSDAVLRSMHELWAGAQTAADIAFNGIKKAAINMGAAVETVFAKLTKNSTNFGVDAAAAVQKGITLFTHFGSSSDGGFLSDAAKKEFEKIDALAKVTSDAITAGKDNKEADIETKRAAAIAKEDADHNDILSKIQTRLDDAKKKLAGATGDEVMKAQAALDEAQEKLNRSLEEARLKRFFAGQEDGALFGSGGVGGSSIDEIGEAIQSGIERAAEVTGTFNASSAGRISAGDSLAQRTASATEKTARNTQRIADEVRNSQGAVFA